MVRKLVEEDKVLFVFQTLGTPPNTAIHKYMNAKKVPHLFVATGASKWGNPKEFPWTMGFQPDYVTEAVIYAKHILANVKDPKIGVLMQNDDYGKDYFNGFKQGLGKDADKLIVQLATYEVTDPTVDSQMIQLKNSGANVFFNITTPKFAAQAIRKAAEIGWKPAHYLNNVSASIGTVMKPAGFENGQGIITAHYIKDPTDPQCANDKDMAGVEGLHGQVHARTATWRDSSNAYGYAVSSLLHVVLKQCGDNLTRENVMKQAASLKGVQLPMVLDGIKVNTSATDFYPIQSVRLARFKGEKLGAVRRDHLERGREPVDLPTIAPAARLPDGRGNETNETMTHATAARFERIKARPAYELVAEAIERKILAGRLKPGDPVGTESELVKQFGVNRSTVREGIRLLEQSGLVAREPSRRLSVAVPHYHRLATRMTRALILQQVTFRELWHTSRALEPAAVDQAMDNATEDDLAGLAANVDKTRKAARDPAAVAELDAEFHRLITKSAHNRVLLLAKEPSSMLVRPTTAFIIFNNPGGIPRLIEAHGHILDALQRRDRDKGRLWVDRHLRDWRAGFERAGMDLDSPVDGIELPSLAARLSAHEEA